jgi:hypothetical protein
MSPATACRPSGAWPTRSASAVRPIRDAMIALEFQGLVEARQGSGVYVMSGGGKAEDDPSEAEVSALELTEARRLFEGEACALAAAGRQRRADRGRWNGSPASWPAWPAPRTASGWSTTSTSPWPTPPATPPSSPAVEEIWTLRQQFSGLRASCAACAWPIRRASSEAHHRIVATLRDRDPKEARRVIHDHLNSTVEDLLSMTERDALEQTRQEDGRAPRRTAAPHRHLTPLPSSRGRPMTKLLLCLALTVAFAAPALAEDLARPVMPPIVKPLPKPDAEGQKPKAAVVLAPYRFNDILWENDRTAHRIYGPALEAAEPPSTSGIDAWGKSERWPYMDRQLKTGDQHQNHGEGLDFYDVNTFRGAGGLGIWQDNKLWTSRNWKSWKMIQNGPDVAKFSVDYAPWPVDVDRKVWETRTFTLPLGTNFTRMVSTISSDKPGPLVVGIGITKRKRGQAARACSRRTWPPAA